VYHTALRDPAACDVVSTWRCPSFFLFFFRGLGKARRRDLGLHTIITYSWGPISVMVLRRTAPNLHRPLRVPGCRCSRRSLRTRPR